MQIILLSGGSGKRLWPLSNNSRSKQFLKLLPDGEGGTESMLQRMYKQIRNSGIDAPITIATSKSQLDPIFSQLNNTVDVVIEPERRDTYPAISLASAYLYYEKKCALDETVIVVPVDPYTDSEYFTTFKKMEQVINSTPSNIVLMGIEPTYPSEKYGYIVPKTVDKDIFTVSNFVEKPNLELAKDLIYNKAVWNGGVFAFKLSYIMDIVHKNVDFNSYDDLYEKYNLLNKNSFDYEVVEKEKSLSMVKYKGIWKDLGTWNTLSEVLSTDQGMVTKGEGVFDTQVINELDIPMLVLGTQNMVIAASPDGILISGKEESSYMKPYVEKIEQRPMYEERRWGTYKVLDYSIYQDTTKSLTKHLFIKAEQKISYQTHNHRDEIWTVVDGTALLLIDGHVRNVKRGDVAYITAGMKHAVKAITDLHIIEVQIGDELSEQDIERYDYNW